MVCRGSPCWVRFGTFQVRPALITDYLCFSCVSVSDGPTLSIRNFSRVLFTSFTECSWSEMRHSGFDPGRSMFLRPGSMPLQLPSTRPDDVKLVRQLADYVIRHHYSHLEGAQLRCREAALAAVMHESCHATECQAGVATATSGEEASE